MNKTLSFYAASAAATWKLRSISSDATDALEQCVKSDPAMLYANSRACMSRARSRCRPTAGRGRVRAALRGGCSRAARALLDSEGPGPGGGEGGGGGHAPRRDRVAQRKRRWRLLLRGPRGRSGPADSLRDNRLLAAAASTARSRRRRVRVPRARLMMALIRHPEAMPPRPSWPTSSATPADGRVRRLIRHPAASAAGPAPATCRIKS